VWNEANAQSSEYSWVPIPEVGYINLGTSEFDLNKALRTIRDARDLTIGAATVRSVIATHAKARKQFRKNKLRFGCSGGARRSLGWVPFKAAGIKYVNEQIRFCGKFFSLWDSYNLSNYDLSTGAFSEDARGRWYFNVTVKVKIQQSLGVSSIGIDLGLKDAATCSDGVKLSRIAPYRALEAKLGVAQRANKKRLVKTIHAHIKNQRKDALHKFSTQLVKAHGAIFVGNVSSSKLTKTKMAKSLLDAGWFMLKTQLDYKSMGMSVVYSEVNERNTTLTCSRCLGIPSTSPIGMGGLVIRKWTCALCGTEHDRDINAAKNILRLGHQSLAVGIPLI
jgi:IS605 OrfB family transposase